MPSPIPPLVQSSLEVHVEPLPTPPKPIAESPTLNVPDGAAEEKPAAVSTNPVKKQEIPESPESPIIRARKKSNAVPQVKRAEEFDTTQPTAQTTGKEEKEENTTATEQTTAPKPPLASWAMIRQKDDLKRKLAPLVSATSIAPFPWLEEKKRVTSQPIASANVPSEPPVSAFPSSRIPELISVPTSSASSIMAHRLFVGAVFLSFIVNALVFIYIAVVFFSGYLGVVPDTLNIQNGMFVARNGYIGVNKPHPQTWLEVCT